MNFLCLAYYDEEVTNSLPKQDVAAVIKECSPHDEALRATGQLLFQGALGRPAEMRTVRPRRSRKLRFTDGPFAETKEVVGGFFMIEAADMDDAVRVASLHPAGQIGGELGWRIEIWPIKRLDRYEGTA